MQAAEKRRKMIEAHIERLRILAGRRPERLKAMKKEGRKIVGHTGRFIPEELIRGVGAVPHYLCRGGEPDPPEAVLPLTLRFISPFARSQLGYHLMGLDPVMPMLDLIAAQCDDCHMSRLADLFEFEKLPVCKVGVPPDWEKPIAFDYYVRSLKK